MDRLLVSGDAVVYYGRMKDLVCTVGYNRRMVTVVRVRMSRNIVWILFELHL